MPTYTIKIMEQIESENTDIEKTRLVSALSATVGDGKLTIESDYILIVGDHTNNNVQIEPDPE